MNCGVVGLFWFLEFTWFRLLLAVLGCLLFVIVSLRGHDHP